MNISSRDLHFIAEHRGGSLTPEEHHKLTQWAVSCVRHGIAILNVQNVDERISDALDIAQKWITGSATVGAARKAAVASHASARESEDDLIKNIARAAGHAVATAHMADHAPGAAVYVLNACKLVGGEALVEQELAWQQNLIPDAIRERVLSAYPRVLRLVK